MKLNDAFTLLECNAVAFRAKYTAHLRQIAVLLYFVLETARL